MTEYGSSADRELVRQFELVCKLSATGDKMVMTPQASHNLVRVFWYSDPDLKQYSLKKCEQGVFMKLMNRKKLQIMVDGPHVEAYLYEMAHEITKIKKEDPKLPISHPYVIITKNQLETLVRNTKLHATGKVEKFDSGGVKIGEIDHVFKPPDNEKDAAVEEEKKEQYQFKKPQMPKQMKKVYDIRQGMPIVIAKQNYGHFTNNT